MQHPSPSPTFVIAEVGQNHDGSLGQAHAFIDAVAARGADAVKFQTHIAEAESTPDEPFRVKFSRQDATRFDYWKRMEFTPEQWAGLKAHAEDKGLVFLSSPFSMEAVELLERLDVAAWKVGSGETGSLSMLERICRTGRPLYVSTGMSGTRDVDALAAFLEPRARAFCLMQCTTAYPCAFEDVGLNVLDSYRKRYGCAVGLSDHTGTIYPSLAAVALGAVAVEVHVTFSKEMFGPDVTSSITMEDLARLVEGVRATETMLAHPVDKDAKARELAPLRDMFGKSAVAVRDLEAGTAPDLRHIAFRKPGGGLSETDMRALRGLVLARPVKAGQRLTREDFAG